LVRHGAEGRRQPSARDALEQDIIHAGTWKLMRETIKDAPVTYYGLAGKQATIKTP
jgi:hypothetical protein